MIFQAELVLRTNMNPPRNKDHFKSSFEYFRENLQFTVKSIIDGKHGDTCDDEDDDVVSSSTHSYLNRP